MEMTKKEYLIFWIMFLVSEKTIQRPFDTWIRGFEDRYTIRELDWMRAAWIARQKRRVSEADKLLNQAYDYIKTIRESGDAGFWDECDLEKNLKEYLGRSEF